MKSKPEWLKQGLQEQKLKKSTDLLLDTESERLLGPPVPPLACLVHSSYFCTGVATAAWPAGGGGCKRAGLALSSALEAAAAATAKGPSLLLNKHCASTISGIL